MEFTVSEGFRLLYGVGIAGLGWVITNLYARLKDYDKKFDELHNIYAKREDMNKHFDRIEATLQRIEDKLDHKQDK